MGKKILLYIGLIILTIGLIIALIFQFKRSNPAPLRNGQLPVVASFYPLYFWASEIGGPKAMVINLTPAGAEPHDYEPTARDIAQIESSRLLIINGDGLEAWVDNIKNNIDPTRTKTVIASEGLIDQSATAKNNLDPHIWLDPLLAQKMVDKITLSFSEVDPTNSAYYQSRATVLKSKITKLDEAYRQGLSHCENKNIITAHAAFAYLAQAYGLKQIAITGLSPEAETAPRQLATISQLARINNIKYIFFESLVSPKLAQTLASEIGAQTLVLNPLEGLSESEMAAGKDYFSEMNNNLINLRIALKCQ